MTSSGVLADQQVRLLRALQSKDDSLAAMYLGALRVLSDCDNQDRFSLAAHGIRELMEKICYVKERQSLGGMVRGRLPRCRNSAWRSRNVARTGSEEPQATTGVS